MLGFIFKCVILKLNVHRKWQKKICSRLGYFRFEINTFLTKGQKMQSSKCGGSKKIGQKMGTEKDPLYS